MTHRIERIGDCELHLGDCREILPTIPHVDAVVTDPPYGVGTWNNRGKVKQKRAAMSSATGGKMTFDSMEIALWDEKPDKELIELVLRAGRHQIVWGWNHFSDLLPPTKHVLVWNKCVRGMHYNDCELAWASQFKAACRVFDFFPASQEPKKHPTQKPLELMRWCLERLPTDARIVLDPFMGSATTGVACVRTGRQFVGIEREPKYFDIACRRIEEAYRQPDMFVSAPEPKAEQLDLLGAAE